MKLGSLLNENREPVLGALTPHNTPWMHPKHILFFALNFLLYTVFTNGNDKIKNR